MINSGGEGDEEREKESIRVTVSYFSKRSAGVRYLKRSNAFRIFAVGRRSMNGKMAPKLSALFVYTSCHGLFVTHRVVAALGHSPQVPLTADLCAVTVNYSSLARFS